MLICRHTEGVRGQRKVGNPCLRVNSKRNRTCRNSELILIRRPPG